MWTADDCASIRSLLPAVQPPAGASVEDHLRQVGQRLSAEREAIADAVRRTSIMHVRALFADWFCTALDDRLRAAAWVVSERVETADGSWTIDLVDNSYAPLGETVVRDPFTALCLAPEFVGAVGELSGYADQTVITSRRWVNRYGPGDAIAPHEDTTGDFQIMICLEAPPPRHGGRLVLANGASADLQRGDLLVMAHASVVHWTTPLDQHAPQERATATCRYYVEGGRLPRSTVLAHTEAGPRARPDGGPA